METATLVLTAVGVALPLYVMLFERVAAWKQREKEQQDQIRACKAEVRHNLDIIAELEKNEEYLHGLEAIKDPALRKLIEHLQCAETKAMSRNFSLTLKKRLARAAKRAARRFAAPLPDPRKTGIALWEAANKIAALQERAELAEESAPNATGTLLSRRVPAIKARLETLNAALALV
jgi:hypothetical protein